MRRGEVRWTSLPDPLGSGPGRRSPVVVIQNNSFNESRINTVIVVAITWDMKLAAAPGNVVIDQNVSALPSDAVVNVARILTLDKGLLTELVCELPDGIMETIDDGLRLVIRE